MKAVASKVSQIYLIRYVAHYSPRRRDADYDETLGSNEAQWSASRDGQHIGDTTESRGARLQESYIRGDESPIIRFQKYYFASVIQ